MKQSGQYSQPSHDLRQVPIENGTEAVTSTP